MTPAVPFCIIGKCQWGVVTACKVPEAIADRYVQQYGFSVLIRDSDFPVPLYGPWNAHSSIVPAQRSPVRYDEGDQA